MLLFHKFRKKFVKISTRNGKWQRIEPIEGIKINQKYCEMMKQVAYLLQITFGRFILFNNSHDKLAKRHWLSFLRIQESIEYSIITELVFRCISGTS
jgi:flagellar biosynthesis protein FlhB